MNIQIGNCLFMLPEKWQHLNRKTLRYIYSSASSNLYESRFYIFKLLSSCSNKLLKQWEKDGQEIVHIDGEKFTEFELELEEVLRQSTDFFFEKLESGDYGLTQNIYPVVPTRFGEGFKNASFNQFATIDKFIKSSDTKGLIDYIAPRKRFWKRLKKWEQNAVIHYAKSCYKLVIDNLPAKMKTEQDNVESSGFGMAMVMMSMAGDKLGTIKETKETNIWDIVVEFNRIDEENRRRISKNQKT